MKDWSPHWKAAYILTFFLKKVWRYDQNRDISFQFPSSNYTRLSERCLLTSVPHWALSVALLHRYCIQSIRKGKTYRKNNKPWKLSIIFKDKVSFSNAGFYLSPSKIGCSMKKVHFRWNHWMQLQHCSIWRNHSPSSPQ